MDPYSQSESGSGNRHPGAQDHAGGAGGDFGHTDYTELGSHRPDEGAGDHNDLDNLYKDMRRMSSSPRFDINNEGHPNLPRTPVRSAAESSVYSPQGSVTRHGYRQTLDSHARLFGAPDQQTANVKPNHMKSDIFGIGFGSGDAQQQRAGFSSPNPITEKPNYRGMGGGDYSDYLNAAHGSNTQRQPTSPAFPAGAIVSDMPPINAREGSGNPVTGAGYQPDGRISQRRQFSKTQFATSKLW